MDTTILMKALRNYAHNCPATELDEVLNGLSELSALVEEQQRECGSTHTAVFIDEDELFDHLNSILYDTYGRRHKQYPENDSVSDFVEQCNRQHIGLRKIPMRIMQSMYEFFGDLWAMNEDDGDNNPDGSFNSLGYTPAYLSAAEAGLVHDAIQFVLNYSDAHPYELLDVFSVDGRDDLEDQRFFLDQLREILKLADELEGYDHDLYRV